MVAICQCHQCGGPPANSHLRRLLGGAGKNGLLGPANCDPGRARIPSARQVPTPTASFDRTMDATIDWRSVTPPDCDDKCRWKRLFYVRQQHGFWDNGLDRQTGMTDHIQTGASCRCGNGPATTPNTWQFLSRRNNLFLQAGSLTPLSTDHRSHPFRTIVAGRKLTPMVSRGW